MKNYIDNPHGHTYSNRYGTVVVEPVSELMRVRDIRGGDFSDEIKFNVDTAEQIVLITENRHSQIAFECDAEGKTWLPDKGFFILHQSASTAWVCRIEKVDFDGPNPTQEIERLNKMQPLVM